MELYDEIFPAKKRLREPLRDAFNSSIYRGAKIKLDTTQVRKQFILEVGSSQLPFMTWSAGQKEFMPLLLSFYHLSPPAAVAMKNDFNLIIIEEPEMGLHPQAIKSILLIVMDFMRRGYQVIISTHSPVFLEFAWAFKFLKKSGADYKNLIELFDFKSRPADLKFMLENVMNKNIHSYYFDRSDNSVIVRDISSLDAGSEYEAVSEWGALSSFSTKASEIVSKVVSL